MFNWRVKAALGATLGLAMTPVVIAPAAASAPQPSARPTVVRISVPMYIDPSSPQLRIRPRPLTVVNDTCGQAFIFLSRVNGNQTRAVYGFQYLKYPAIGYTAGADFINEDTGLNLYDRDSGKLLFRTSFQRDATKPTGSGIVTVYGHLHSIGVLYNCDSTAGLFDTIYVH